MSPQSISDIALPGLSIAADPNLFLPALCSVLMQSGREIAQPDRMTIVRIRHRQGERAVIHAEFGFRPAGTPVLPASIWLHADGKAKRRAAKAAVRQIARAPVHEPMSDALVYFFPSDPYVPEMADFVSDPHGYAGELLAGFAAPPRAPEVVRFRPGVGAAFRWRGSDKPGAYVKIQKESDALEQAVLLERIREASRGTSFSVPRSLGASARINALAMEEVAGGTFGELLAGASPSEASAVTQKVLRALRALHERGPAPADRRDRDWFAGRARSTAARIAGMAPDAASRAQSLANLLAQSPVMLAERPSHCDIKLEHIVFSGRKTVFLDLDSFALSDPLYDVAMLDMRAAAAAHTGSISKAVSAAVSAAARRAALADYGADAGSRFAWLKACAALQLAGHFVQSSSPRSAILCSLALEAGDAALGCADLPFLSTNPPPDALARVPPAPVMEQ
jgi:Phosphotransferase enzyme family